MCVCLARHTHNTAVAKDLGVSVARLLKKCREFGILRWPYRHVSGDLSVVVYIHRAKFVALLSRMNVCTEV